MVQALLPAPSKPNTNPIRADSHATLHFLTQTRDGNRDPPLDAKATGMSLGLTEWLFDDTLLSKAC